MINIQKTNDSNYLKLVCSDKDIFNFIHKELTIRDKNYFYNPLYKAGTWDGFIRFLSLKDKTFVSGLVMEILKIIKDNKWEVKIDRNLIFNRFKFTEEEIKKSLIGVDLFEDQIDAIRSLLRVNRGLAKLPTSSGKSYIEISIANLFYSRGINNIIIVVPRATIGEQIHDDLISKSSYIKKEEVGRIYSGSKDWDKKVIISTWQSLNSMVNLDPKYGERFQLLIQDEVHCSSQNAKVVKNIILSFPSEFKYGFSATILSKKNNAIEYYNLVGLFGAILAKNSIKSLQKDGRISNVKIYSKILSYNNPIRIDSYNKYEEFVRHNEKRRKYIFGLIKKIREENKDYNGLILIRNVDFAKEFTELLKSEFGDNVHFISGEVKIKDRIEIKEGIKKLNSQILVATTGTFSIGENLPNLNYLILLQVRKSEIEIVQNIGRLLRISEGKSEALVFDITDNICVEEKRDDGRIVRKYFGKKHLKNRLEVFKEHGLDVVGVESIKI